MSNLTFLKDFLSQNTGWSGVGDGWIPLIVKLHMALIEIDPNYRIDQIKEKFGTLRFYASCSTENYDTFRQLISEAEEQSGFICEDCGNPGEIKRDVWIRCACERCYKDLWMTRNNPEEYNDNFAKIKSETLARNLLVFENLGLSYAEQEE